MIATSQAYKDAIRNGNVQRVLINMGDVILTNEDISVSSGGIKFDDRFNEETELTFGATPSNSISISLINQNGFFNDYDFGEFSAAIGVLIETSRFTRSGSVMVQVGDKTFTGQTIQPYLLEDGEACKAQPDFGVRSIVVDNGTVYCFGANPDESFAFRMGNHNEVVVPRFNAHMRNKVSSLIRNHLGIVMQGNVITDFLHENRRNVYEYVKLGTFLPEPNGIKRKSIIALDANDRMMLFDEAMIDDVGLTFPTTLKSMLTAICRHVGVECVESDFINSNLIVQERPEDFEETTIRETLAWIAEAACSYAKINRDGRLELRWFSKTDAVFNESRYSDFSPMPYQVSKVNGLKIRNGNSTAEDSYGSSDNAYLIQDNPFLRPDDSASTYSLRKGRSASSEILDRVASFESFTPATASLFTDPSVEAGDIVTVHYNGKDYSVPVYSTSTKWSGQSVMSAENSGEKKRTVPSLQKRQEFASGQYNYAQSNAIGGLGGRATALEERTTYAEIQIDENIGKILLIAGENSFEEIDGSQTIKQAYIDIDGANANITLNSSAINSLDGRVSSAEINLNGLNGEITLKANKVYVDAQITQVKKLIADEIDAAIADLNLSISETIVTEYITVTGRATLNALALDGSNVSKTTIPVVTSFTQASGESAPTKNYTILTTAVGNDIACTAGNGETVTF